MNRKLTPNSNGLEVGRYRLANKKTRKLASNTSWLIDLAAIASMQGQTNGIASLLPLAKAKELLVNNQLEPFRPQKYQPSEKNATSHSGIRKMAQEALPLIAILYLIHVVPDKNPRSVNRKGFVAWIVLQMANHQSELNHRLKESIDFQALAETQRGERWWLDQLKMQSKYT